jgi:hypothetical protein
MKTVILAWNLFNSLIIPPWIAIVITKMGRILGTSHLSTDRYNDDELSIDQTNYTFRHRYY